MLVEKAALMAVLRVYHLKSLRISIKAPVIFVELLHSLTVLLVRLVFTVSLGKMCIVRFCVLDFFYFFRFSNLTVTHSLLGKTLATGPENHQIYQHCKL